MINRRDWFLSVGGIAGAVAVGGEAKADDNSLAWLNRYSNYILDDAEAEFLYFNSLLNITKVETFIQNSKDWWPKSLIKNSFKNEIVGYVNDTLLVLDNFYIGCVINLKENSLIVQDILSKKTEYLDCGINLNDERIILALSEVNNSFFKITTAYLLDKDENVISRNLFLSKEDIEMLENFDRRMNNE